MAVSALPESDVCSLLLIGTHRCELIRISNAVDFTFVTREAFTYYQNCDGDDLRKKLFVGILVTLDGASSAAGMAWIYQLLVAGRGNSAAFESGGWPVGMISLILPPTRCLSDLFFARRLHILSGKRWITLIIAFFSMLGFCGGIGTGIAAVWIKDFSQFGKFKVVAAIGGACPVIADVTITVVITYYLHRSKGNFEVTDRLLDRVIQLAVQNCALTSSCEIVSLSLYYALDKPYFFGGTGSPTYISTNSILALLFLAPMFHVHSVLSSLNARKTLRSLANATVDLGGQSLLGTAYSALSKIQPWGAQR
ncbi:hypothetical protein FIBSPDRAFT_893992 [Athelia psychrophila]|uniref:DUF6534 domain-containing protein n=1 Tax=Athelia psychrophila TaxID=1759441 RepID=A0A166GE79_9AGAM|nr:hypothetical protein FIBSPDRAFT_893992 [Fibularhizoctonia sp. CBS 109695]